MLTEKIQNAQSKIMNGDLSHGIAFWEEDPPHDPAATLAVAMRGSRDGPADTNPHQPRYYLKAYKNFRHYIQYSDLSVFPSRVFFLNARFYPISFEEIYVSGSTGPTPEFHPFSYPSRNPLVDGPRTLIPTGSSIQVDCPSTLPVTGEYRVGRVIDEDTAVLRPTTTEILRVAGSPNVGLSYTRQTGQAGFWVKVAGGVSALERDDGSYGVQAGEFFLVKEPFGVGVITGIQPDQFFVSTTLPETVALPVLPAGIWQSIRSDWFVSQEFQASFERTAPCALYDLTLAFTRLGYGALPSVAPSLSFRDEVDGLLKSLNPVAAPIVINLLTATPSNLNRYIYRFLHESAYPYAGPATLEFAVSAPWAELSNFVLYRGDFTKWFLKIDYTSDECKDDLNGAIGVESEIIPKGTIIGYTGGWVCPPGFARVEGIGSNADPFTGSPITELTSETGLWVELGDINSLVEECDLDDRTPGLPRTRLKIFESEVSKLVMAGVGPLPYQYRVKLSDVTPFRDTTGQELTDLINFRGANWDPQPIWVMESFERLWLIPGFVLEFRISTGTSVIDRVFMVVTQAYSVDAVTEVREERPDHIQAHTNELKEDVRFCRHWVFSHAGVSAINDVFKKFGFFGSFTEVREDRTYIELMGAWDEFVDYCRRSHSISVKVIAWKNGVVAHAEYLKFRAQVAGSESTEESGLCTYEQCPGYDYSKVRTEDGKKYLAGSFGGYGYFGEPHSHSTLAGDAAPTRGVAHDGWEGTESLYLPVSHTHGYLFPAVSIPKVRPVLLCQRL